MDLLPSLEEGIRFDLTEEDFGLVEPYTEQWSIKEIAERFISDIAPPIVEPVARDVTLECTEKILADETQGLENQHQGA